VPQQLPLAGSFEIFMHTEVTDSESGFTGNIIARQESETGRRTYLVAAPGQRGVAPRWFHEDRIRPPAQVVLPKPVGVASTYPGGPRIVSK